MKIVTWTRDNVPDDLELTEDGDWAFVDHRIWFNLEIGDQIQYVSFTGNGTRCYFVTDVCPFDDEEISSARKLVIIEE